MITLEQAIKERHSVRSYEKKPLGDDVKRKLNELISQCNSESGLNIQLVTDEPKAFDGFMAHYGKFSGVSNYIAMIGKKDSELEEKCGYYGERLVLEAQRMGLNTCWVAMTYKKVKSAYKIGDEEKLCIVIAIGYGKTNGVPHKSKNMEAVANAEETAPEWFIKGIEAALLAPTAVNQQKFVFTFKNGKAEAKAEKGFYSMIDLGIVKYHFEIGAGRENFNGRP